MKLELLIQLREKRKEKAHTSLFLLIFFFFFSFTLWKNHHGDVTGEHAQAQPLGGAGVWGGSHWLPGLSHVLSRRALLQAGHGFLSPASSSPLGRGSAGPST